MDIGPPPASASGERTPPPPSPVDAIPNAAPPGLPPGEWHLPLLDAIYHAPFPALVHAENGEVLQVSAAWTELSGYTHADIPTIAAWTRAAYGDGEAAARGEIRSLFERRIRVDEGEHRIRTRDGRRRVWSFSSAPLGVLPDGRRVVLSMAADVTGRVRAEGAHRRAEARWRFLARAGRAFSSTLDHRTALRRMALLAVPALADHCMVDRLEGDGSVTRLVALRRGRSAGLLPGLGQPFALDPEGPFARALRTGEPELVEVDGAWVETAAGPDIVHARILRSLRPSSALLVPLVARGRSLGLATLLRDARRRQYTRKDLAIAHALVRRAALAVDNALLYEASEGASSAKSEFLAVVSHELKTPLNAVIGYAGLLEEHAAALPGAAREYPARVLERARDLLQVLEQMLTVARLEAGRERAALADVDVAALVDRAAAAANAAAAEKGLRFRVRVERPLATRTDPERVERVLASLLSNAVKFTEAGGVEVEARREQGGIAIEVRDTGIGIEPRHLEAVFEPFWQADRGAARAWEGIGLGLTVARRLAQLLGGGLDLHSSPGEGSAFVLRLPAAPPGAEGAVPLS